MMRKFVVAGTIGLALVGLAMWGCDAKDLVGTDHITEEDVNFILNSTSGEFSAIGTNLQDPGSPVLQRYYTGGFFFFSNNGEPVNDFYLVLDTLSDSIMLDCVTHSNDGRMDNDHDMVYDHDTITFTCDNQSIILNRNNILYSVEFSIMGKLIHQDNDENDRGVLSVSWTGLNDDRFYKYIFITDLTNGDTLTYIETWTNGLLTLSRNDAGLTLHKETEIQDSSGRTLEINIDATLDSQDWQPGDEIVNDMDISISGSGVADLGGGKVIGLVIDSSPSVTIGICDGSDQLGVKGGTLVEELYLGDVLVKTIDITFNSDCSYTVNEQ